MTIKGIIVLIIFALLWVWTVYEMHVAPEVDDNGNIIKGLNAVNACDNVFYKF